MVSLGSFIFSFFLFHSEFEEYRNIYRKTKLFRQNIGSNRWNIEHERSDRHDSFSIRGLDATGCQWHSAGLSMFRGLYWPKLVSWHDDILEGSTIPIPNSWTIRLRFKLGSECAYSKSQQQQQLLLQPLCHCQFEKPLNFKRSVKLIYDFTCAAFSVATVNEQAAIFFLNIINWDK